MSDIGKTSDGYHTFDELYEHRHVLYMALCWRFSAETPHLVWRSHLHADGTMFPEWFVLGIDPTAGYQITYHLPLRLWDETGFARTLPRAPEWDGHTPADVMERIRNLLR